MKCWESPLHGFQKVIGTYLCWVLPMAVVWWSLRISIKTHTYTRILVKGPWSAWGKEETDLKETRTPSDRMW